MKNLAADKELIKLIVKVLRESMYVLNSLGITTIPKETDTYSFSLIFFWNSFSENCLILSMLKLHLPHMLRQLEQK